MLSISSSVTSESFDANTWSAPWRIMLSISSLLRALLVLSKRRPCWITNLSSRSLTSAFSTIFSSTVLSVISRKTRTCFSWPIRWARSYKLMNYLNIALTWLIKSFKYHGLKIHLGIPIRIEKHDYIGGGQVNTETTGSGGQHENKFAAARLVIFGNLPMTILMRSAAIQAAVLLILVRQTNSKDMII